MSIPAQDLRALFMTRPGFREYVEYLVKNRNSNVLLASTRAYEYLFSFGAQLSTDIINECARGVYRTGNLEKAKAVRAAATTANVFTLPEACTTNPSAAVQQQCACLQGVNNCSALADAYFKQLTIYSTAHAQWQTDWNNYVAKTNTWNTNLSNEQKRLQDIRWTTHCNDIFDNCMAQEYVNKYGRDLLQTGTQGCDCFIGICGSQKTCRKSDNQVAVDITAWKNSNPKPSPPASEPQAPVPPGCNVMCCSMNISDLSADTINITELSQNCSQTINQTIADLTKSTTTTDTSTTTTTSTPPSTPPSTPSGTNQTFWEKNQLAIILSIVLIVLFLILVGIIVYKTM